MITVQNFEVSNARKQLQEVWNAACRFDKIDRKSKFVVFSDANPFNAEYQMRMNNYLWLAKMYQEAK